MWGCRTRKNEAEIEPVRLAAVSLKNIANWPSYVRLKTGRGLGQDFPLGTGEFGGKTWDFQLSAAERPQIGLKTCSGGPPGARYLWEQFGGH